MGWADEKAQARIKSLPAGVRYLGYVSEADLPALTRERLDLLIGHMLAN